MKCECSFFLSLSLFLSFSLDQEKGKKNKTFFLTHDPQEMPDLGARHVGQRVKLDQRSGPTGGTFKDRVDLHDRDSLPRPRGLVLALARHPRRQRLELAAQGLDLADAAALCVAVLVEGEHALLADQGHGLLGVRERVLDSG